MNLIFCSVLMQRDAYYSIFSNPNNMPGIHIQNFHKLLVEGLSFSVNKVFVVSSIPLNRNLNSKFFIKLKNAIDKNIIYIYMPVVNMFFIKNLFILFFSFINVLLLIIRNRNDQNVIICDALNLSVSLGAYFAGKLMRVKVVGVVTDLPEHLNQSKFSIDFILKRYFIQKFDKYVLLTKYMKDKLKLKNNFIVIEGFVSKIDRPSGRQIKKVLLYSGTLAKKYGVKILVESFIQANLPEFELHIYGTGDYDTELIEIQKNNSNVKYFGAAKNEIILECQTEAFLLINPRQNSEEYTKYSFPSKNLEYLASGRPLLAYKLDGIPNEYDDYILYVDGDSKEDLAIRLREIVSLSSYFLSKYGENAKKFVLENKNNIIQANKIINFLNE